VIQTGGKQYRVSEGDTIEVEKLPSEVGQEIRFSDVLLIGRESDTLVGRPTVPGACVTTAVVYNGRGPKITIFKYKRRKNFRRKQGHRQSFTRLLIKGITVE
jgi:large subunit ribosomal protein L21